jgi:hypothetical protein
MPPSALRDQTIPALLVAVRLGAVTLSDTRLADACARTHGKWGVWGFSVLEVPDSDHQRLARLRPIVAVTVRTSSTSRSGAELDFTMTPTA